jgi:hypothetical protein
VIVRSRERSGDASADNEDVRVEVIRIGRGEHAGAIPPMPPMPPLMLPIVPRGKGETKSLGSREFDGIKADGTMTSHTIPAGENRQRKADRGHQRTLVLARAAHRRVREDKRPARRGNHLPADQRQEG